MTRPDRPVNWKGKTYPNLKALVDRCYQEGYLDGVLDTGNGAGPMLKDEWKGRMRRWIDEVVQWASKPRTTEPRLDIVWEQGRKTAHKTLLESQPSSG